MSENRPRKSGHRESGIVQRLRNSVRQLQAESPRVLLACSGGKDSVALAWILSELRRLGLLTFSLAHIHHGQHDRADLAAAAVHEIGHQLDAAVAVHRLDQGDIDSHIGVGLEEAMRRERYLALARIAQDQRADCIVLAHHQTDQAETILLHLIRGAGLGGLAGMREWEHRRIPWWSQSDSMHEIGIWRPLIDESACVVAETAVTSGLPIVEDPTNSDPAFRRNAIRHQVLPVLERIAEGATAAVARSANLIAGDSELLEQMTGQALVTCISGKALSRAALVEFPEALQSRIVRRWVLEQVPTLDFSAERAHAVVDLAARNRGGAAVDIGFGHRVTLQDGLLSVS